MSRVTNWFKRRKKEELKNFEDPKLRKEAMKFTVNNETRKIKGLKNELEKLEEKAKKGKLSKKELKEIEETKKELEKAQKELVNIFTLH